MKKPLTSDPQYRSKIRRYNLWRKSLSRAVTKRHSKSTSDRNKWDGLTTRTTNRSDRDAIRDAFIDTQTPSVDLDDALIMVGGRGKLVVNKTEIRFNSLTVFARVGNRKPFTKLSYMWQAIKYILFRM